MQGIEFVLINTSRIVPARCFTGIEGIRGLNTVTSGIE